MYFPNHTLQTSLFHSQNGENHIYYYEWHPEHLKRVLKYHSVCMKTPQAYLS